MRMIWKKKKRMKCWAADLRINKALLLQVAQEKFAYEILQ